VENRAAAARLAAGNAMATRHGTNRVKVMNSILVKLTALIEGTDAPG